MSDEKTKLISEIQDAFRDVVLEDGIGLSEADAIDSYMDSVSRAACRTKDEKKNWNKISSELLNQYYNSLSFFDAKGMRFHLPAFMIAEINGEYRFGMSFPLAHLSDYSKSQFVLLTEKQKQVVKQFLNYIFESPDYEFERHEILRAIESYWSK
jgi:hypothetical protein